MPADVRSGSKAVFSDFYSTAFVCKGPGVGMASMIDVGDAVGMIRRKNPG
jgi:hypothetical protein